MYFLFCFSKESVYITVFCHVCRRYYLDTINRKETVLISNVEKLELISVFLQVFSTIKFFPIKLLWLPAIKKNYNKQKLEN